MKKQKTTLKAFTLSLAMAFGMLLPTTTNAQSDGFFRGGMDNYENRDGDIHIDDNIGGGITNDGFGAPLGSGLLIMVAAGAGYALARRKRSHKGMAMFLAIAMVMGLTQCKKEQTLVPANAVKTVNITLKVGGNGGSRHDINTTTGAVDFQDGDVIYVGDGSTYIGTLTRTDGVFSGPINEPANGTEIYFYFVGGLTPSSTPVAGTTPSFTVDISDQSTGMPVLSCNHVTYTTGTTSYSCVLQNQCALVQFTTASTTDPVHAGGLYTGATINFGTETPGITNNGTTGFVALNSKSATEKWAVLLPQTGFEDAEAAIAHVGYTTNIPTIAADAFITGDAAVSISTPSDIIYLDWLTGNYTATDGKILTGKLAANVKVSIADGATVTLDGVTINGVHNDSYRWAGITCNGDATIILKDGTTNTVKGFHSNYPGIYVPTAHTLTIQGEGSLDARVNTNDNGGAGIGAVYNSPCGNIEIQGGTVSATGGIFSAGIGSANKGACGNITISGGTVTANGGNSSAGIGSGYGNNTSSCGNITISGGTVTANGNNNGAGIGTGENGVCGNITISGGTVTARGSWNGSGIGSGDKGGCGTITIENTVKRVTAVRGYSYCKCIGCYSGSCGTVTIGGTVYSGGATPNQSDNKTFIYPNIPEGAINGLFSVSSTKQVCFSKGSLQATTTNNGSTWTWSFATNQWDYIGNAAANKAINGNGTVSANGTVDLFGWSTSATYYGINNSTSSGTYSGDFKDWGGLTIGSDAPGTWRTLSDAEWTYLFTGRTDVENRFAKATVNNVRGVILLPDNWSGTYTLNNTNTTTANYTSNTISESVWTSSFEANGAVFLPTAGFRNGTSVDDVPNNSGYYYGHYWSSEPNGTGDAYRGLTFSYNGLQTQTSFSRAFGFSVRLVKDVN